MPHKAKLILDKFYDELSTISEIKELLKNRVDAPSEYPGVVVRMGNDTPEVSNASFLDSELTVHTDIYVVTTENNLDDLTLEIRAKIHQKIFAIDRLGLSWVLDIEPLGQSEPDYSGEGEDYTGGTRLSFAVKYRSSYSDPTL